jgi:deoxyribonuclease-4
MINFKIGCHVSAAGGVWNAPKNAAELECETFQIFTRPPMGGPAPKIDEEAVEKFKSEMRKYFPASPTPSAAFKASEDKLRKLGGKRGASPSFQGGVSPVALAEGDEVVGAEFVVHAPYIVNFGSAKKPTYHGSISIVSDELKRANLIGAKYVMTHLGSFKDLGPEKGMVQAKAGFVSVMEKYEADSGASVGGPKTQFLLEIAAGSGEVIGDTFEELAELMEPLTKFKTFGGICFDTQHAFSSGYDLRDKKVVEATFKQFDKAIGLKWLKMSHINDSKIDLGGRKDRHEHIGDGKIGEKGFGEMIKYWKKHLKPEKNLSTRQGGSLLSLKGETSNVAYGSMPLILETDHDKVETDIKILKKLRNKI